MAYYRLHHIDNIRLKGMLTVEASLVFGISFLAVLACMELSILVYDTQVLESRLHEISVRAAFEDLTDDEIRGLAHEKTVFVCGQYGNDILHDNKRNEYLIIQMERVIFKSLRSFGYHLSKGGYVPRYFEHRFTDESRYRIRGTIDRIDVAERNDKVYVKIIDYKSSNRKPDVSLLYYGLSLQLPIYLNEAGRLIGMEFPDKKVVPAAMLYETVTDPVIKDSDENNIDEKIKMALRSDGLFINDEEALLCIDPDIAAKGHSDVVHMDLGKDGTSKRGSQDASEKEMESWLKYAGRKAGELIGQISGGMIDISPVTLAKPAFDSCEYCAYKSICGYDERTPGYRKTELCEVTAAKLLQESEAKDPTDGVNI